VLKGCAVKAATVIESATYRQFIASQRMTNSAGLLFLGAILLVTNNETRREFTAKKGQCK
jgi:hypothetical protein